MSARFAADQKVEVSALPDWPREEAWGWRQGLPTMAPSAATQATLQRAKLGWSAATHGVSISVFFCSFRLHDHEADDADEDGLPHGRALEQLGPPAKRHSARQLSPLPVRLPGRAQGSPLTTSARGTTALPPPPCRTAAASTRPARSSSAAPSSTPLISPSRSSQVRHSLVHASRPLTTLCAVLSWLVPW